MKNDYWEGEDTVVDPDIVTFLHDKVPIARALSTQTLLHNEGIDFFGNDMCSGGFPDLNPTENFGDVLMDSVSDLLEKSQAQKKYSSDNLTKLKERDLRKLSEDTNLLEILSSQNLGSGFQ